MQYIILDGKTPTHGFKDGKGTYTKDEVKGFDNVAVIVPKGFVVLDFDSVDDAEIMLNIVNSLDLKCRVMQTTRGIHCWFKVDKEHKNAIASRLAIGLYCDKKAGGRNAYVKIRQDGKERKIIKDVKLNDVELLPKWLEYVGAPNGKFKFKEMGAGSGRNQELFNYIVYLQTKGFDKETIKKTLEIINDYVFEESLPSSELATITRDEAFKPEEEITAENVKEGFDHADFGDKLMDLYNIKTLNNRVFIYDEGYYKENDCIIENKMIDMYRSIKDRQRTEVLKYIKIKSNISAESIKINPYVINVNNTRLDVRTGECLPFTAEAIEFDRIPVVFDPSAYSADVDKLLNKVFCSDGDVILLFEEMLGYMLLKHARYQKAFLLYGTGSNGKSTVLDMIKSFLSAKNYSTIALEKVCGRFDTIGLEHKLANVGDDIDNVTIKDTGTLKKIFAGNALAVENKGEKAYTIEPYAVHVYSANTIPKSFDKSDGFYRRWCLIPFNAKISPSDVDYDPMILDKVTTDKAKSYLLNMALRGVRRLIQQNGFTEPRVVALAMARYKVDNSLVLSWLEDADITEEFLLNNYTTVLFKTFSDWCSQNNTGTHITANSFYKELRNKYGFSEKMRQRSDGKRYFDYDF